MSIQFSEIHNLVRTYQRALKLDPIDPVPPTQSSTKQADRVSISRQARELGKTSNESHTSKDDRIA